MLLYKIVKNLFFYFIGFLNFLILIILNITSNYQIYLMNSDRIGHFLRDFLFCIREKKTKKVIWIRHQSICNDFVYQNAKRKFIILEGFLSKIFFYSYLINKKFFNIKKIYFDTEKNFQLSRNIQKLIKFESFEQETLNEYFKKLGLYKKFICLHVRDQRYLKKNKIQKWKSNTFRKIDIKNYKKMILFFLQNGFQVVQVGSRYQNNLNIKNKNFINYYRSEYKSDAMDFYLAKKCEFVIGSASGWEEIPYQYNKKIICTNLPNFVRADWQKNTFYIFKNFYSKYGKKIKIEENIINNLSDISKTKDLDLNNIILKENTSKELLMCAKEFYKYFILRKKIPQKYLLLNKRAKLLLKKHNQNLSKKKLEAYIFHSYLKNEVM
jgi:putative glycosyltransferase (TIGR04372 family)